jgi:hypothetical protein
MLLMSGRWSLHGARIAFSREVKDAEDARRVLVGMVRQVRSTEALNETHRGAQRSHLHPALGARRAIDCGLGLPRRSSRWNLMAEFRRYQSRP